MATAPIDARKKEELIELADKALYHSKRNGRNQAWHYRDIIENDPEHLLPIEKRGSILAIDPKDRLR